MTPVSFTFEPYRIDSRTQLVEVRIIVDGLYCGHLTMYQADWLALTAAVAFGRPTATLEVAHIPKTLEMVRKDQGGGTAS